MFSEHEIEWNDEKIARLWDYFGRNASVKDMYFTNLVGRNVLEYMKKHIDVRDKEVLDYGSGPGHLLGHVQKLRMPIKYSALDNSEESIQKLIALYSKAPQFKHAYYVDSFPTNIQAKFDIIISCEVIEHLEDNHLESMLKEFKDMLNLNGVVMITTPNAEELDASKVICPECGCIYHRIQHVRSWDAKSLSSYMESKGFQTLRVESLNLLQKNILHRLKQKTLKILSYFGYQTSPPQNLVYIGKKR